MITEKTIQQLPNKAVETRSKYKPFDTTLSLPVRVSLLLPGEYTAKDIQTLLSVGKNWVNRNKKLLDERGVIVKKSIERTSQDELRLSKSLVEADLKDYRIHSNLIPKIAINLAYLKYGLTAPFQVEDYNQLEGHALPWVVEEIEKKFKEVDLETYLKDFLLFFELSGRKLHMDTILEVRAKNLLRSLDYLKPLEPTPFLDAFVHKGFQDIHGFEPTEEQRQVCSKVLRFLFDPDRKREGSISVQSVAGASKTTIALVLQYLIGGEAFTPYICALTNKSLVKVKYGKTISKLLNESAGIKVSDTMQTKMEKAQSRAKTIPLLIVDESSMVGIDTRYLLETLSVCVIYLGDPMQLQPIKDRAAADVLYIQPLREQYRFTDAPGGKSDSYQTRYTQLNMRRSVKALDELFKESVVEHIRAQKTSTGISFENSFKDEHIELLKQYIEDDSQILVNNLSCCSTINEILNDGLDFKVGSKVILTENKMELGVFNGFQFRILELLDSAKVRCKSTETGKEYELPMSSLELSYAITTAKAQGSEWPNVLSIANPLGVIDRRDRYVSITRARIDFKSILVTNVLEASEEQRLLEIMREHGTAYLKEDLVQRVEESSKATELAEHFKPGETYLKTYIKEMIKPLGLNKATDLKLYFELRETKLDGKPAFKVLRAL